MFTVIPIAGKTIVEWLWGGFTVNNPTLNRFFSIHFILPFLIAGVTLIHLALLHKDGSNNPIGSDAGIDDVPFYPYFVSKDMFAFFCFLFFFGVFVMYFPNVLNHPDNCIPADPMETPAHVVPEWYFLPFYAILRSIPKCEIAPLVIFKGLYETFAKRPSVIHPKRAESNSQLVLSFGTRLRNLNSQPNRGQPLRSVAITSCVSRTCWDSKAGRALMYESTDYVCKVMRTPNVMHKLTVGGFYGSSSLYDRLRQEVSINNLVKNQPSSQLMRAYLHMRFRVLL